MSDNDRKHCPDNIALALEKSMPVSRYTVYKAILKAARKGNYITYGEIGAEIAPDTPWSVLWHPIIRQLDILVEECAKNNWPIITSIVVNKEYKRTGDLSENSLKGFMSPVNRLNLAPNADPRQYLKRQQVKTFEWALNRAPANLDSEAAVSQTKQIKIVRYFGPILDALREAGGSAKRKEVFEQVKVLAFVTNKELRAKRKNGRSLYENEVVWARYSLCVAGLVEIDEKKRGIWRLTSMGWQTFLDLEEAYELYREIQSSLKSTDYEQDEEPGEVATVAVEGRRHLISHQAIERRSRRREKLDECIRQHGLLMCECCGEKGEKYPGDTRERTFEVHHRAPLAKVSKYKGVKTSLSDLAVLCANCHRAIHAKPEVPSISEFKSTLQSNQSSKSP